MPMATRTDRREPVGNLAELADRTRAYCSRNPAIQKVAVFGSFARGEQGPSSDVDLIVGYADRDTVSTVDVGGLYEDLASLYGREVDILTSVRGLSPRMAMSIKREGKVIYER